MPTLTLVSFALSLLAVAHAVGAAPAHACTAFAIPTSATGIVAKSYDWGYGGGLAFANPRGAHKRAWLIGDAGPALTWTSRHASLTFNQLGRDMPMGGMNEAGLVVEILWLEQTRYESPDPRPSVNESQWIQWQLDTASSVAEVLRNAALARVAMVRAPVHYFVCDRAGACAVVEYLQGRLAVHHAETLVTPVLANDSYATSMHAFARYMGIGAQRGVPRGHSSSARFLRAAEAVRAFSLAEVRKQDSDAVAFAFDALTRVRQPGYTQWQLVYETRAGRVHFRLPGEKQATTFDVSAIARRSCSEGPAIADLAGGLLSAPPRAWQAYSRAAQEKSLAAGLDSLGVLLPDHALDALVRYPERTTSCAASP